MLRFCILIGWLVMSAAVTKTVFGTDNIRCAAVEVFNRNATNHPDAILRKQQLEAAIEQWVQQNATSRQSSTEAVITIPVVVHVIYNTESQNISDAQIQSQIERLNKDFSNTNADKLLSSHPFYNVTGVASVEFCLAAIDPNGNGTTGITRTFTDVSEFSDNDDVKFTTKGGENAWNATQYLNIWVCNLGGGLLGYAQFPSDLSTYPETDGVVIGYSNFGTTGVVSAPYDLGRTATHEIGHWLNLEHVWGDDEGTSNTCSGSDKVSDTPNQAEPTYGCPSGAKTDNCTTASPGINYQNYMDYTDDACMVMFTKGQVTRMSAVLNITRSAFKTSNKCSGTTGIVTQQTGKMTIYPNPVQNYLTIEGLPKTGPRNFTVEMYNAIGEKVYSTQISATATMLEMEGLRTGSYVLVIYNEEVNYTQKLTVVK